MRPDEHKKKKNIQYKKKHGISSENSKREKSEGHSAPEVNKNVAVNPLKSENENLDEIVVSEEISESATGFSRRQIESNWGKYEGLDQDDEDIGTDYNVLLSFAGGAHSYKHVEEEDGSENYFSELSIDCNHLVDSLEQLSFVDKYMLQDLNIDPVVLEYINTIVQDKDIDAAEEVHSHTVLSSSLAKDLGFDFSKPIKNENKLCTEETRVNETKDSSFIGIPRIMPSTLDVLPSNVQSSEPQKAVIDVTSCYGIPMENNKDSSVIVALSNELQSTEEPAICTTFLTDIFNTDVKENTCTEDHEKDGDLASRKTDDVTVMKNFEFDISKQERASGLEEELVNLLMAPVKESITETDPLSKGKSSKNAICGDTTEEAEQDLEEWLDSIL